MQTTPRAVLLRTEVSVEEEVEEKPFGCRKPAVSVCSTDEPLTSRMEYISSGSQYPPSSPLGPPAARPVTCRMT
ncbi:hypothetical protein RRG08_015089 [Elysia crispata]|uniref:Uncharacterized protein n=1 Tax=Elysia crispata TaxID=231223 RepID=A0AAE1B5A6_9GAST|nr:hypothetical protein RRG08_015089 [Elysia crispata]